MKSVLTWFATNESVFNPLQKSNRSRMFPFTRRRERVVEAHREVADEQAASVGDFKTIRRKADQAVGGK